MAERAYISWLQVFAFIFAQLVSTGALALSWYMFSVQQTERLADLADAQQKRDEDKFDELWRWEKEQEAARQRDDDAKRAADLAAAREVPRLHFQTNRRTENGHRLVFTNTSPTYDVVISHLRFLVVDSASLRELAMIHSPPPPGQNGGCAVYGRNGQFYSGCWNANGTYEFRANVDIRVPKGGPEAVTLLIANSFYRNQVFEGDLYLYYDSPYSPALLHKVEVPAGPTNDDFLQPATEPPPAGDGRPRTRMVPVPPRPGTAPDNRAPGPKLL